VFPLLAPGADLVVLVKPQFEAQPGEVEDGGLVRDPAVHARTCAEVAATLVAAGFTVRPAIACALRGATGNQEYLLAARRA
jgi:23S rRNA (cytidine1920-2'-O)/16S rRNA (cytidine1409-2'-O)-methyltransferase